MKQVVHVNQHNIRANARGADKKVLTIKTYKDTLTGNTARLIYQGVEIGKFVYQPNDPLACGAKVWFETNTDILTIVVE